MTEPPWKTRISAARADLQDADRALAAATSWRDRAREALVAAVRAGRPTESESTLEEFLWVLRPLYWEDPSVDGKALAAAAGFRSPAELARAIGPAPSGVPCAVCGRDIPRTSRSSKAHESQAWAGSPICPDCYGLADDERRRRTWVKDLRKHFMESSPVAAPAWESQVAVRVILAYPPVSTQVGQGSEIDQMDGTWRTYRRAGALEKRVADTPGDVTAHVPVWLAQSIIPAAHAAGWDAARTRELT